MDARAKKIALTALGLGTLGAIIWYASRGTAQAAEPDMLPSGPTPDYVPPPGQLTPDAIAYSQTPAQTAYQQQLQRSGNGSSGTTTYMPSPGTASSSSEPSRGDPTIQAYQQRLYDLGYDPGPIDGRFGSLTRRAVTDFQRDQGLTADGILGPRTKAAIDGATGTPAPVSGLPTRYRRRWAA